VITVEEAKTAETELSTSSRGSSPTWGSLEPRPPSSRRCCSSSPKTSRARPWRHYYRRFTARLSRA
jgi:hypothetical protein